MTEHPLPSNRQHLSYDVSLEVRGEIIRTVLCCSVLIPRVFILLNGWICLHGVLD